ncbi:MAG: protein kinase [Thermoanaerobaculia bacterium]|nr:protein kinase [Thermoanaerobaculia bacterium]
MNPSQSPSTSGPQNPSKLGRYEIIEQLGKGAMGLVFLARDPIIGRQLALKTFHVGFSAKDAELEQFRQRFVREAQSAGILSHPNIVTIHDVLVEGNDDFFIAMEYVDGTDLKLLMQKQGRFEVRHAVDIASQVADGLGYAHSRNVVHRDIKPANVILTPDGQAKITDFGIARMDTSNLTVEGQLLGTPNYMAPEQIQAKDVDHRADLFSLGVVLYEMLTGRKPFKGENLTQVSHKIAYEAHPDPREFRPEVPPRLVEVLDRALAKAPDERYQKGVEMAADLRSVYGPVSETGELPSQSFLAESPDSGPPSSRPPSEEIDLVSGRVALPPESGVASNGYPAPAAASGPPPASGGKALWIAGGAVFLMVLVAIGFLAGQGGSEEVLPPPVDPQVEARRQADPLVEKGREALEVGDPTLALDFFDQALALAPGDKEIRSLRDDASRRILQSDTALEEKAIEERIGRIETAIALKEWDRAISEARELLSIEPDNNQAAQLLEEATSRRRAARAARDRLQGRRPTTAPPPETEPAETQQAAKGTVHIDFQSDISKGVLTVFQAGKSLFKEDFEFVEEKGKGIFRRTRPSSGSLSHTVELEATDQLKLHVYAYRNGATVNREISGNLPPSSTRTLRIKLGADGVLSVRLE